MPVKLQQRTVVSVTTTEIARWLICCATVVYRVRGPQWAVGSVLLCLRSLQCIVRVCVQRSVAGYTTSDPM
jgi:hypothetical protein